MKFRTQYLADDYYRWRALPNWTLSDALHILFGREGIDFHPDHYDGIYADMANGADGDERGRDIEVAHNALMMGLFRRGVIDSPRLEETRETRKPPGEWIKAFKACGYPEPTTFSDGDTTPAEAPAKREQPWMPHARRLAMDLWQLNDKLTVAEVAVRVSKQMDDFVKKGDASYAKRGGKKAPDPSTVQKVLTGLRP